MIRRAIPSFSILTLWILCVCAPLARTQTPTGTISGVVAGQTGAPLRAARIIIVSRDKGLTRNLTTSAEGNYSAPALPPGTYSVKAEAMSFSPEERIATVEAGTTTTVSIIFPMSAIRETVIVTDVVPLLNYEQHQVGGLISSNQIENLPLNGRNFLELSKLEPGVTTPTRFSGNRTMVPVLSSPGANNGSRTRVTVDGGSIMAIFLGGPAMQFSQEGVREFQLSSVNFDLSTGMTASGAVNIVTRSGGNEFHGGAFYFYRDHNLAAYPALRRDRTNPDPFFQREQFGLNFSGPLRQDNTFFFLNWEKNDQRAVTAAQPLTPEFMHFGQIVPSPNRGTLLSARVDLQGAKNHHLYLRYSHDGSRGFGPSTSSSTGGTTALPSNWTNTDTWADQSIFGLTSTFSQSLVNELRFSYFFISTGQHRGRREDCPSDCIGAGWPQISVAGGSFVIGSSLIAEVLGRRYHLADSLNWQVNSHRLKMGVEYEYSRGGLTARSAEPVQLVLFSPDEVKRYNDLPTTLRDLRIPLPNSFSTVEDILRLPVRSFTIGIGNPQPYQPNSGRTKQGHLWHLYLQDTWRLHPRLTINYGVGWFYDPHPNRDLSKPTYLEPLLGLEGLKRPKADRNNFSPSLGFAWMATRDGKTVMRGGTGIYYDPFNINPMLDQERHALGPRGTGRTNYEHTRIANPIQNLPGVPFGLPLNLTTPSLFTGTHLMAILPALRADLLQRRGDPNNRDFSIRNIEVDKLGQVALRDLATPYAVHVSLGALRQLGRDLVLAADFVYRSFSHHAVLPADYNRFFSIRGPVIPVCVGSQREDPQALCSAGEILVVDEFARAKYKGVLMRLEKRLTKRTQFLASYAYSSNVGNIRVNNDDWSEGYGPLDRDVSHILNVSAVFDLPRDFQIGFNSTYYSAPPFTAFVSGMDFNGDGTNGDALPETSVNRFNRGLGKHDLIRAVSLFNQNYAGGRTSRGQLIPPLVLPAQYNFGDNYLTQDLRLSRMFDFRENFKLLLFGEVFNLFNIANLSGHSGNLGNPATFGQPIRRVEQVFGSGGPRAVQFGARLTF